MPRITNKGSKPQAPSKREVIIPSDDEEDQVVREEFSSEEEEEDDIGLEDSLNEDDDDDDDDEEADDDEDEDDEPPRKRKAKDEEEESSSEGDGDEDADEEDEGNETRLNAVGSTKFSNALKSLLSVSEEGTPTTEPAKLFQRKTKLMKLDEQEKQEKLKLKKQQQEKQKFDTKNVVMLPETDPAKINAERDLKRIATRGVVALFNAIGAHQRATSQSASASIGEASKESFLKMLQEKATGKISRPADNGEGDDNDADDMEEDAEEDTRPVSSSSGWKVLQDDYLENEDDVESDGKDDDAHAVDRDEDSGDDDDDESD